MRSSSLVRLVINNCHAHETPPKMAVHSIQFVQQKCISDSCLLSRKLLGNIKIGAVVQ